MGMNELKTADIDDFTGAIIYEFDNENRLEITCTEQFNNAEELRDALSPSQIQLLIYLLYRWREQGGNSIFHVEAKDYFRYRGIKVRKDSKDRFERDLTILSALKFQLLVKKKKDDYYVNDGLLQFEKVDNGYYEIQFNNWIEHLSQTQYTLLHKHFFKFHPLYDHYAILLTIKLSQIYKLQLRKKDLSPNIKFYTLCKFLNIKTEKIKRQGYENLLKRLQTVARHLEQCLGFTIHLKYETESLTQFYDSKLYYDHPILKKHYQPAEKQCQ